MYQLNNIRFAQGMREEYAMVKFTRKLDRNKKIYLPKVLREAGFNSAVDILANAKAIVVYPSGTDLEDVSRSLAVIQTDVKNRIDLEEGIRS